METTKILHPPDTEQITLEDVCERTRREDAERLRKLAEAHHKLEKQQPDFMACAMLSPYRGRLVELAKQYGNRLAEAETSLALGRFIAEKFAQPRASELLPSDILTLLQSLP